MDKYKKAKNAIYCIDVGEGKKKIEFLQIGKEWVQSKTVGGYGLKKGTFLSFINHKGRQAAFRKAKAGEFYVYSRELCHHFGLDIKSPQTYASEFNKSGYYELRKQECTGNASVNSFWYKLNGSFPVFKDAWNTPFPIVRPAELGGFGLTHGIVLFYLIDKCLLNKSETFKISQRQIAGCFGLDKSRITKILDKLAETGLVGFSQNVCEMDLDFFCWYFKKINLFWHKVKTDKIESSNIQTAMKDEINQDLLDVLEPFK